MPRRAAVAALAAAVGGGAALAFTWRPQQKRPRSADPTQPPSSAPPPPPPLSPPPPAPPPAQDGPPDELLRQAEGMALGINTEGLVSHGRKIWSTALALWAAGPGFPAGDIVETGTYTGGTTVLLMKALQQRDPNATRLLWAADSFRGLPPETAAHTWGGGAVEGANQGSGGKCGPRDCQGLYETTRQSFEARMRRHQAFDTDRLRILEGWFNETLPAAPIRRIAYLRLDGDLFVSTWDALQALYHKVSPGGLVYVDDYGSFAGCKAAVTRFRQERGITADLKWVPDFHWVQRGGRSRPGKKVRQPPPKKVHHKSEAVWWRVPL